MLDQNLVNRLQRCLEACDAEALAPDPVMDRLFGATARVDIDAAELEADTAMHQDPAFIIAELRRKRAGRTN